MSSPIGFPRRFGVGTRSFWGEPVNLPAMSDQVHFHAAREWLVPIGKSCGARRICGARAGSVIAG